jgi:transposase InsO family protein
MPNQLSALVEQRILAFALGHPGLGPRRIAAELARPRWGGLVVSANGVWRCLRRHGLNTRAKRLSLVAGYAAPYEPPRPPTEPRHVEAKRPGELVGLDCFFVGRLHNMKQTVWQLTAIDVCSSYAWAELVSCPQGKPGPAQTSKLAQRVAAELQAAGWKLERVLTDNGSEFRGGFEQTIQRLDARATRIRAGRPQTNGAVEALHKTILDECWRPSLARYLQPTSEASNATSPTTCATTTTSAPTPAASPAAASPPASSTVPAKWKRDEPHPSAHPGGCPL